MSIDRSRTIARGWRPFSRLGITALLVFLALGQFISSAWAADPPVYPDLVPLPSANLYMERSPDGHFLLRFDSTTANYGGPLEIAVKSLTDKQIYQNLYDKRTGGKVVVRTKIGADLLFHPTHNHFHFQGFGEYELLKQDKSGVFRETSREGEKTSFCILDLMRVASGGPPSRFYSGCGATMQGMSSGWADIYIASLSGQWIDVGTNRLPDGTYGIRTTADPLNKIYETKDFNNEVITYFTVTNGRIVKVGAPPPLCNVLSGFTTSEGAVVTVGSTIEVNCSGFKPGETVSLFWGSINTTARATAKASASGIVFAPFTIPTSDLGVHYILGRGNTSATQAAAVVNIIPNILLTPSTGHAESTATATLRGFSANESIDVGFYKTRTQRVSLGTVTASSSGSASLALAIPATIYGTHTIDAKGLSSGQRATAEFMITPSLTLSPAGAAPGDQVGIGVRGFGANEMIRINVVGYGSALGAIQASYSGSTRTSVARVTIPSGLDPGVYTFQATGLTSGAIEQGTFTVLPKQASEDPTATATVTTAPTEPATETATATESPPESTAPATVGATETATREPTLTATATEVPATATQVATETATETATTVATETATAVPPSTETPTPTGEANAPPGDP